MPYFIVRRLLSGVVTLVVISMLAYLLLYAGGGDIARNLLGSDASASAVEQKAHELGLDRPLIIQFGDWAAHAITGDFGNSWLNSQPVTETIINRASVTLSLVIGSTLVTIVVSIALGIRAATSGGWIDKAVQFLTTLGEAVPNFLMALGLVLVFGIALQWFQPTGYVRASDSIAGWLSTVTLPILALSFGGISRVTQQVRGSALEALERDYVRTLRSGGISPNKVLLKHVLRNASGPALAVLSVHFAGLLGGAVVIEQMFGLPGLGQVAVDATLKGDIPLVMGLILATAVLVIILNIVVDLAQAWINPKVRLS